MSDVGRASMARVGGAVNRGSAGREGAGNPRGKLESRGAEWLKGARPDIARPPMLPDGMPAITPLAERNIAKATATPSLRPQARP